MKNGDKVVCIKDSDQDQSIPMVKIGEIYTITGSKEYPGSRYQGTFFSLKELGIYFYWHGMFRPVDDTYGSLVEKIISKQVELELIEA